VISLLLPAPVLVAVLEVTGAVGYHLGYEFNRLLVASRFPDGVLRIQTYEQAITIGCSRMVTL